MVGVQLDAEDLAKLRVRPGGGPFTEAVLSIRLLGAHPRNALGSAWLDQVRPRIEWAKIPLDMLAVLESVADLHSLATQAPSIAEAVHELRDALTQPPMAETTHLHLWVDRAAGPVRRWLRDLLGGDSRAQDSLVRLFLHYYQQAVEPFWRSMLAHLEAERARCGLAMAEGGVDHLLSTLHPTVRWRAPVLQVGRDVGAPHPGRPGHGQSALTPRREARVLGGRSLVLVPSTFCMDGAELVWSRHDPHQPVALLYPALRHMDETASLWAPGRGPDRSACARLLGATRADALVAIADTCTTTALAHRVGVSLATASHHAAILRSAGLVVSRRNGGAVLHRLSPLGAALIGANPPATA